MSAGSFQRKDTANQITPPSAKSNGPMGYNSGKPAFTNVPMINTAVAIHLSVLPVFTFSMPIMLFLLLLFCSLETCLCYLEKNSPKQKNLGKCICS